MTSHGSEEWWWWWLPWCVKLSSSYLEFKSKHETFVFLLFLQCWFKLWDVNWRSYCSTKLKQQDVVIRSCFSFIHLQIKDKFNKNIIGRFFWTIREPLRAFYFTSLIFFRSSLKTTALHSVLFLFFYCFNIFR